MLARRWVAGWDNDGGRCAIALLGRWRHRLGMRAVAGVDLAGAALLGQEGNGIGLKRDVTINMLLDGACGKIVRA